MLFNSLAFAAFLPLVFAVYWLWVYRHVRLRNAWLLAASYFFYGYWDYRFLALIILSSFADYVIGLAIYRREETHVRRRWLFLSLFINLGILATFKYAGFFVNELSVLLSGLGIDTEPLHLDFVLPVGISFYTFQSLSYTLDIYYKRLIPTRDPLSFFAFVAFFPQLVAGPIERASHLLPQFQQQHIFKRSQAVEGLQLMLWGLFKKLVIADRIAQYVDPVFAQPDAYQGLSLILASLGFAIQIYGDFSGYSDMAIGTAKLFGFELRINFRHPYTAASLRDFWSRWHISLSTWFRDYVYIPLGGNRTTWLYWIKNLMLTFLLSGLWHGANWTFIFWGGIHGVAYSLEALNRKFGWVKTARFGGRLFTLSVVCLGWIFFRSASLKEAMYIIRHLGTGLWDQLTHSDLFLQSFQGPFPTLQMAGFLATSLVLMHVFERKIEKKGIHLFFSAMPRLVRWSMYYLLISMIIFLGAYEESQSFIYFQF